MYIAWLECYVYSLVGMFCKYFGWNVMYIVWLECYVYSLVGMLYI
jgi:hypothetical protein